MVFRGFYGVFYDSPESEIFLDFMGRNFPFYHVQSSQAAAGDPGLDLSSPFQTDTPTELTIQGISPELRNSYDHSWGLTIQNHVSEQWQIEIAYQGRKGVHEYRVLPGNVPLPGPGEIQARRPNPEFGEFWIVSDGGSSTRHELEFEAERRLADGYSLGFQFEWARRFDDNFDGQPSDPRNLRAEWAPRRGFSERSFSLNYIIDLPFGAEYGLKDDGNWLKWLMGGWRVSGITEIQSGKAFSVFLPGDPNNDGLHGDRPDRLGSGHFDPSIRSIDQWFNTDDFGHPAAFEFGNAGRNTLVGPAFHKWDVSLVKEAPFADNHRLQLRLALYNAFNHPNFDQPNTGTRMSGSSFRTLLTLTSRTGKPGPS